MVHSQLVFFDRDPSLWLTHNIPRTPHGFTEPALLAARLALSMACLATLVFLSCNPRRDAKYGTKGHANISISFNNHARVAIFAALFYLIYTTVPGLLICLSTVPIRSLAKPTPLDISLAGHLHKPAITLLVSLGVVDERVLRPSGIFETNLPLSFRLVVSAQKFVSWLLAGDRPATYYPILMAISTGNKIALNLLRVAAGARPSVHITHKAGLLVLTLGFTAIVQSVSVFIGVSALKQAALVAPGFATTLGLDILASLPSLAFRYTQEASKWQTATECAIGSAILNLCLCYTRNFYNLRSYANIFLGDHTTGGLNSITTQAVAFGVLLFPCLIASQLHSTFNIVGLLPFFTFTPATMQRDDSQSGDSQQPIGKERPVENIISTDSVKVAPICRGLAEDGSTTTTATPESRSNYGTIIRTHPSALYWKLANVCAWVSSPNLRYRSIDGWEYTFNDSDLYDVYLLMAGAFKRVFDEILGPVPTKLEPKTLEALVVKYMQKARKELLHSLPSSANGRGLKHRRPDYRRRQSTPGRGATSVPTPPLSSIHSDSSDHSEPTTPTEDTRSAAVQLKDGSRSLGNKIKAAMANPVNHQVQVQFVQTKFRTGLPPVVELDEETNATVE